MNKYEKQAKDFLNKTNSTLEIEFLKHDKHFIDDADARDIYKCTLKKDSRVYTFNFGNSINDSGYKIIKNNKIVKYNNNSSFTRGFNKLNKERPKKLNFKNCWFLREYGYNISVIEKPKEPTHYDILACLNVDDCEDFDDFCDCYGYSNDSIKAKEIYKRVQEETTGLKMLYNDEELELLGEVQ